MQNSCPNCGDQVVLCISSPAVTQCKSCDTTLLIATNGFEFAKGGHFIHDRFSPINIGDEIMVNKLLLSVFGAVRYSYGLGWWDEWYCEVENGEGFWLSVDEGDYAIQRLIDGKNLGLSASPKIGDEVVFESRTHYLSEIGNAELLSFTGSLPILPKIGEKIEYFNFEGAYAQLLSAERSRTSINWYFGNWIDPFELRFAV